MEKIGADRPDVALFAKSGRVERLARLEEGHSVPKEFFYGYFDLAQAGYRVALFSAAGAVPGFRGTLADRIERTFAAITGVGARPLSLTLQRASFGAARVLISCVDGFSLTLALGNVGTGAVRIGGFQGLSDIERRSSWIVRPLVRRLLRHALSRLDHVFFLSPADRDVATERYGLSLDRSTLLPFCVDTEFWHPAAEQSKAPWVFAVGQDQNRDFETLVRAPGRHVTRILTALEVDVPPGMDHITVSKGGFALDGRVSDEGLRDLYQSCLCVVVPLKDVYQPSGQSVTIQAMSCGKPVILTRTKGLWDPHVLRHGENCMMVAPGDSASIGAIISRFKDEPGLAQAIGAAARKTAEDHYGIARMGAEFVKMADWGMELASARDKATRMAPRAAP